MAELYDAVHKSIRLAFLAAFIVDPMSPSLSLAELRALIVQDGHSGPLFDEAWPTSYHAIQARGAKRGQILLFDIIALNAMGEVPPQLPRSEALEVLKSFEALNRQQGAKPPKPLVMLARPGLSVDSVQRGLGLLLLLGLAQQAGDGFVSQAGPSLDGYITPNTVANAALDVVIERVRTTFAARDGGTVAATPPIERFHLFLEKQGLAALAGWWAMTTQELRSVGERHPTAATVLAASMLEAALVAVAELARQAGAWKRDFLDKPSKDWKLGALIDQAEIGYPGFPAMLNKNDAGFARSVAELRNRIHVGKYVADGLERFRPPFTNAHEASLALKQLDLLLTKVLEWASSLAKPTGA